MISKETTGTSSEVTPLAVFFTLSIFVLFSYYYNNFNKISQTLTTADTIFCSRARDILEAILGEETLAAMIETDSLHSL